MADNSIKRPFKIAEFSGGGESMKRYAFMLAHLTVGLLLITWTHAFASDFGTTRLRLAGSGSLTQKMGECAKEFNQKNPNKSVMVIGGHTADGFMKLFDGTAEIAMASRRINENEKKDAARKGMKLAEKIVGYGIVAIVVQSSNPINELTVEQLRKIFSGDYKIWSEVGGPDQPIQLVVVDDPKSGGGAEFKEDVLRGNPFPPGSKKAETFLVLTQLVAETAGSIGYCSTRYLEALQRRGKGDAVKALSLKTDPSSPPLAPVRPASGENSYPLLRPYYLYWNTNAHMPLVDEFLNFCNGKN
jgi:phosphate transport system substrate-binding protein